MNTEQYVHSVIAKVLKDNEKVVWTQRGLDFLLTEVYKILPTSKFIISSQSLEEMSAQDRAERKLPTITVEYQK